MMANEELESSSIELLFMPISTLICADFFWVIFFLGYIIFCHPFDNHAIDIRENLVSYG